MKITHVLGHNSSWNVDAHVKQNVGDYFLISAFTHGNKFSSKTGLKKILNKSMIDLQFYGKKHSTDKGAFSDFAFHPINCSEDEVTSVYFENCVKRSIDYQRDMGFKNIIIPHFYENEEVGEVIDAIKKFNKFIPATRLNNEKYFMTLPFANHIIIDKDKVEEILSACTDMAVKYDGYFVVCENKPEVKRKITYDLKVLRNLSKVLKTLKQQEFETIYAYANWDAIIMLAQTDIDYITIGTYENMRNFDIRRFTEDKSGGGSKGYYFSSKLLNMVKADDVTLLRETGCLELVKNDKNIFSDLILQDGYEWNIHKADINKNYLLEITKVFEDLAAVKDLHVRKGIVLDMIQSAIKAYNELNYRNIYLDDESGNYHLNAWKSYLANA